VITRPTVIVLGAGASVPYWFYSGEQLFHLARALSCPDLVNRIPASLQPAGVGLHTALQWTQEFSVDAMLERENFAVLEAGKALMARYLLLCEQKMLHPTPEDDAKMRPNHWHRILWAACDTSSLENFGNGNLRIITYNYDRSVDRALFYALRQHFKAPVSDCAAALAKVGPIHLHGQLGGLPDLGCDPAREVPFGGRPGNPSDDEILKAASEMKIIHEAVPDDDAFVEARKALKNAVRVIFLGFSYAPRNVERLLIRECLSEQTSVYLCATGFTEEQFIANIRPQFFPTSRAVSHGREDWDIVQFFRHFPEALN